MMINKHELARMVKNQLEDATIKEIELIIEVACEEIVKAVNAGDKVRIVNFASFEPSSRKAHEGVDPSNPTQTIKVPEIRTIRFRPCQKWKDVMNCD